MLKRMCENIPDPFERKQVQVDLKRKKSGKQLISHYHCNIEEPSNLIYRSHGLESISLVRSGSGSGHHRDCLNLSI